ncbi:MFS transporter [Pantoea sp. 1.19]|uniref:MFS transporter n=1 Tax=Pantoea sp. 1.19 TaxID=1925589 RepID=UPI0009F8B774|nr:MFS transporter [Pantoea sp. 1.19]
MSKIDVVLPESLAADSRAPEQSRHRSGLFLALAIMQATLIFTIVMVGVPLPAIAQEFSLAQPELLLISAGYGLPFSGLLLFGGRLSDRLGGKSLLRAGALLFGGASLVGLFAPSYAILVAVRLLQGVGAALIAPALMAILRQLYPDPAAFGRAMATWGGVSVLGGAVGFLSSGMLTTWVSWRWMFIVPVAVALLGLWMVHKPLRDLKTSPAPAPLDIPGALLATLGIMLLSFGLIASGEAAWSAPVVYAPVLAGTLCLMLFFVYECRVAHPLLPVDFLFDLTRGAGLVGILLAAAGMGLITFLLSLYLQQIRGWSPLATSLAFIPYTVALLVVNRAAHWLIGRFHALTLTLSGLVIGAVGLFLLGHLTPHSHYGWDLLPGLFILPAGASLVFSGSAVLATAHVPLHRGGLAGGVMNTAMELGPTMGLAALMALAATQTESLAGFTLAFNAAGVVYLLAAAAAALVAKRIYRRQ